MLQFDRVLKLELPNTDVDLIGMVVLIQHREAIIFMAMVEVFGLVFVECVNRI